MPFRHAGVVLGGHYRPAIYQGGQDFGVVLGKFGLRGVAGLDVETVKRHRFSIRSRIAWIDFMAALKAARLHDAVGVLLKDMRQTPYVVRELARMVARRFGGARKV